MKEKLQVILDRANTATPGPWTIEKTKYGTKIKYQSDKYNYLTDANFITHARTDVPVLAKLLLEAIELLESTVNSPIGFYEAKEFLKRCEDELK